MPVDQFHKGKMQYCKACRTDYFKETYDPQQARRRNFRHYYKHDDLTYDHYFELQNGVCAICGNPPEEKPMGRNKTMSAVLATDHNHKTGKVRGLLCHRCNFAVGWVRDNSSNVHKLIEYIDNDGIDLPLT